jgi:rhodanese-related sulfurtransferase
MRRLLLIIMTGLLLLTGCGAKEPGTDGDGMRNSYRQIGQEEAAEMMRRDDGHVVVDVRRQDEYDAGHIPGAILIPNETIGTSPPKELPDPDQIILIYCRSGNRSKQAAQKLFDMGYTNLYEFGGILTWDGEIVTEDAP